MSGPATRPHLLRLHGDLLFADKRGPETRAVERMKTKTKASPAPPKPAPALQPLLIRQSPRISRRRFPGVSRDCPLIGVLPVNYQPSGSVLEEEGNDQYLAVGGVVALFQDRPTDWGIPCHDHRREETAHRYPRCDTDGSRKIRRLVQYGVRATGHRFDWLFGPIKAKDLGRSIAVGSRRTFWKADKLPEHRSNKTEGSR